MPNLQFFFLRRKGLIAAVEMPVHSLQELGD